MELGLTMKQVAEAVGVSEATVSRWEIGQIGNMRRDRIAALSDVLHVPYDFLLADAWEGEPLEEPWEKPLIESIRNLEPAKKKLALTQINAIVKAILED